MIPSWMRGNPIEAKNTERKTKFNEMSLSKFGQVAKTASLTNQEKQSDALRKVDSWMFQIAHPEIIFNDKTTKLIDHYLATHNITWPTYEDFGNATDFLICANMIDQDEAVLASQADGNKPRSFIGPISGRTYDSIDSFIAQERQEALNKLPAPSQEEIDLASIPLEEFQAAVKNAEHQERVEAHKPEIAKRADAFLSLRPEIVDSERNANLINMQLADNGVAPENITIDAFNHATNQLLKSGLLTLNKHALAKQRSAEVAQLAKEALAELEPMEDDAMYGLSMEELRRRADRQLANHR
jgi:hypothetical protein